MVGRHLKILVFLIAILLAGCARTERTEIEAPTPTAQISRTPTFTMSSPVVQTPTLTPAVEREYYLGLPAPGLQPEVFLPGMVSSEGIELFFALHPNLEEAYFTRVARGRSMIMVTFLQGDQWTDPAPASFSSDFQDVGPFISPDGETLYFWSNRPLTPTTPLMDNHQIWVVEREGDRWGEPRDLELPLESLDGEWDVSVTASGTLYYMANYPSRGGYGLYRTEAVDGVYQVPEKIEVLSNEEGFIELEPVISPDEKFLLFYSVGREDNLTPEGRVGDLYISTLHASGRWSEPQNLGPPVNSESEEATPALSPDGRFLFFASNRDAPTNFPDIYWVSIQVLDDFLTGN